MSNQLANEVILPPLSGELTADDAQLTLSLCAKSLRELASDMDEFPVQRDRALEAAAILEGTKKAGA